MTPNCICFSTALSDPHWFHNDMNKFHTFVDSNGVLNGLRCPPLVPGPRCYNLCSGPNGCAQQPSSCDFLLNYRKQLDSINLIWLFEKLNQRVEHTRTMLNFKARPHVIFLVHEAPDNPCSERWVIQSWLRDNGIEVVEWIE